MGVNDLDALAEQNLSYGEDCFDVAPAGRCSVPGNSVQRAQAGDDLRAHGTGSGYADHMPALASEVERVRV